MNNLRHYIDLIPSLGHGGKSIGNFLIDSAMNSRDYTDIIDLGPWLGSTTAHLAYGVTLSEKKKDIRIISYDRWIATQTYKKRAKVHHDIEYELDQDLLPIFKENIAPFKKMVKPKQGDIIECKYKSDRSVELLIDDCCTGKDYHDHMMKTFSPYFVAGKTILVLMDYCFYEKKPDAGYLHYQKDFMNENKTVFMPLFKIRGSMAAVFRYMGGEISYKAIGVERPNE